MDGAITLSCANPTASSPTEQDCRIDLTGLPIASVSATCSTSECYDPTSQQDLTFREHAHPAPCAMHALLLMLLPLPWR